MNIVYFDFVYALEQHKKVLEVSGGLAGYRDKEHLHTVIEHVKNDDYYPDFSSKLSYLIFSVAKGHIFNDGNKRTAIALGAYFLELNALGGIVGNFIVHMEYLVVWLVENKISRETLQQSIESIITTGDVEEFVQVRTMKELDKECDTITA